MDIHALVGMMRVVAAQHGHMVAEDGYVVPGSYDPTEGVIDVMVADSASVDATSDQQPEVQSRVQLLTPIHMDQAGPIGGERVLLIPARSGWRAILEHGTDDSPNAPQGARYYVQPNNTGTSNKYEADGSIVTTTQKSLSQVAPEIGLGDLVTNLDATHAVIRMSDVVQLVQSLMTAYTQSFLTAIGTAAETANIPNATQFAAALLTELSSITAPTVPDGSAVAKAK